MCGHYTDRLSGSTGCVDVWTYWIDRYIYIYIEIYRHKIYKHKHTSDTFVSADGLGRPKVCGKVASVRFRTVLQKQLCGKVASGSHSHCEDGVVVRDAERLLGG